MYPGFIIVYLHSARDDLTKISNMNCGQSEFDMAHATILFYYKSAVQLQCKQTFCRMCGKMKKALRQ